MAMINLKLPKRTKKELESDNLPMAVGEEQDRYPYGTTLTFEKESIGKSDFLKSANADVPVKITATGFVREVRVTENSNTNRDRHHVEIQITDIEITGEKRMEDMNMKEFAKARGKKL